MNKGAGHVAFVQLAQQLVGRLRARSSDVGGQQEKVVTYVSAIHDLAIHNSERAHACRVFHTRCQRAVGVSLLAGCS